jgi:hypothetical protein
MEMEKSAINMSKPVSFYVAMFGFVMLLSTVYGNIDQLHLSNFIEIPFRREISASLFVLGSLLGAWSIRRHLARVHQPWRVAQSQVSLPFLGCIMVLFLAIIFSR